MRFCWSLTLYCWRISNQSPVEGDFWSGSRMSLNDFTFGYHFSAYASVDLQSPEQYPNTKILDESKSCSFELAINGYKRIVWDTVPLLRTILQLLADRSGDLIRLMQLFNPYKENSMFPNLPVSINHAAVSRAYESIGTEIKSKSLNWWRILAFHAHLVVIYCCWVEFISRRGHIFCFCFRKFI